MTQLAALTLSQIAAAYGALSGVETGPKTFNSKAKGIARLEALLAERTLTVADALRAAGITMDTTGDEGEDVDGCEPEQFGPYGEDDIPGTEDPPEPGMVWDGDARVQPEPAPAETDTTAGTDAPADADLEAAVAATEETFAAEPSTTGADAMPVFLGWASTRAAALEGFRDALIVAGHDEAMALAATGWLDGIIERSLNPPASTVRKARTPRADTKQEQVLDLLRRDAGATLDEIAGLTNWKHHTIRGFFAGALKKKLGITVASEKVEGRGRVYRAAGV